MSIENLPDLATPDHGSIVDPRRPILSYAWQAERSHRAAAHHHPRAQIIHPVVGAYWVVTPGRNWLVPTGQAIWIPPRIHHEVFSRGAVSAMMLFVDESCADRLPPQCGTVEASPLLRELLRRTVEYGNDYAPEGREARLARVMLDELAAMEVAPLFLPISTEPRLARVMERLIDDPGSQESLDVVAKAAGASARTLARLFRNETGMTFPQWKTRLRLVASIDRLNRGASVTEVALELGYSSTSAFVFMFRNNLGISPGRYVEPRDPEP
jgi:AraC-like DNA-binding protein